MIVSFSVSNFRSFSSEETISLVASNRLSGSHAEHTVPIPDSEERVLRAAVLYGANGAGKSNLFKALRYVESIVLEPRKKNSGTGRKPFRFGEPQDAPSSFDLQFIAADKLYRFGFKVDDERVAEEWLFRVVGSKQKPLYERTTNQDGKVEIEGEGIENAGEKLRALATVGGLQNQSFLATVNATLDSRDFGEELGHVLTWFRESLQLIGPDQSFGPLEYLLDQSPGFRKFAGAFLRSASTGVDHLEVLKKEISKDELTGLLPGEVVSKVLRDRADDGTDITLVGLGEGDKLLVERKGADHFYQISVRAAHEHEPGRVVELELTDESDGTRRLLNLMPALHHLRTAGCLLHR